jgi:hypothetical protein
VVAQRVESVTNENSTLPLCIPIVPCNLCGNVGGANTGCHCGNVGGASTGCNCGNVGGANTGCNCGNVGGVNTGCSNVAGTSTGCGCHHRRRWYR